jgi:hypothetical protein
MASRVSLAISSKGTLRCTWRLPSIRLITPSFRNEIYPAYKANREPAPVDLQRQFALCREFCRMLGVAEFASPRYEADDIIGTLATRARESAARSPSRAGTKT